MSGEQPPPKDTELLSVFHERDGRPTRVEMADGSAVIAFNIAWGYDMGDEYSHVTTNASPFVDGASLDFFCTSDVARLIDPESGRVLFESR
jgi:hypothetical protein